MNTSTYLYLFAINLAQIRIVREFLNEQLELSFLYNDEHKQHIEREKYVLLPQRFD